MTREAALPVEERILSCSNTWALTKPTSRAGRQGIGRDLPPCTQRFSTWDAIRNVVAHGSWRLPDGHVESFQTGEEWAAGLRPGSVVDLLVGPKSVLILGPHAGTEPAPALPPAEESNP